MNIQIPEDEKITDFISEMTDSLRSNNLGLYFLLISSTPDEFYGFALQSTRNIMIEIRLR